MKSSWRGELADKRHDEFEDDDSPYTKDLWTLIFTITANEKIKLQVAKNIYNSWEIGNQAEKISGELLSKKFN